MKLRSRFYLFFWINYFVQSTVGVIYEPLNYILKDQLHLTAGQASGFYGWMTFPLLLKPLYGYVSDFIPLGRYRRKPHLIITSLVAVVAFFAIAAAAHYRYLPLLLLLTLAISALAFADAVCGGLLVEDGKLHHQTGRYQALHIGALYLGIILVGAGGGWLTTHVAYRWIFTFAGLMPLAITASASLVNETVQDQDRHPSIEVLWDFIRTRDFWALALTIVLWNFYPFLGTVQFYYQTNVLGLSPQWIGSLMTAGSAAGLIGSAVFWKYSRENDTRKWISWGPAGMALISLTYLLYRGRLLVACVEIMFGFGTVFFRLALLDLVARTCPAAAEATSYALFLSLFDLAMYGSNTLGGKLFDALRNIVGSQPVHDHFCYTVLILIGAGCTLACRWTLRFCTTAAAVGNRV